jgi:hypothetical protein
MIVAALIVGAPASLIDGSVNGSFARMSRERLWRDDDLRAVSMKMR